ncbi:hypothetical protein ABG768_016036 [Culter alburnus]|uniref:Uncharacterized protein n=1 Tax=Culter alburnus TaxID=194366 RepID=A0AAW1YXM3_CULAL
MWKSQGTWRNQWRKQSQVVRRKQRKQQSYRRLDETSRGGRVRKLVVTRLSNKLGRNSGVGETSGVGAWVGVNSRVSRSISTSSGMDMVSGVGSRTDTVVGANLGSVAIDLSGGSMSWS